MANVETEPETQMPLLFVTERTSSQRSLFAGTLIRLMRYGAEKESSCIALDW